LNRALVIAPLLVGLIGCTPALKSPPDLGGQTGTGSGVGPQDVDGLLGRAEELRLERTVDATREAASLYLRAAAADTSRSEGLVGAIKANLWLASNLEADADRKEAAVAAVHAGQWCERARPGSAPCDYWLAVALGVQARERRNTGHDALPRIVELLEAATEEDPELDEAGPHRVLALVLLRAPGWPTGPGDPDLGLEQAREAVRLRPGYPPNQLCLAEALNKIDDPAGSRQAYERALKQASSLSEAGHGEAGEWIETAEREILALGGLN